MARFGFCGPAYTSQSVNADAQACINLYPEQIESGQGKSAVALYPTPGLSLFATCSDSPHRASVQINGRYFVISGSTFFEIDSLGNVTNRGVVANDGNPASLAASATQVMIASGGQGYCFVLAANTLTGPIANIAGVIQVGYTDGYFVALLANSATIQLSGLLDGTSWNPADKAIVSVFPGNIVSMVVDHREICLLGNNQSVCYYDSGNVFPFDVIPGGFMEQGSGATFGASKADNTYLWWGNDERGGRVAWKAQGYSPQRISTHAIEYELSTYSTISDAVSFSYQSQGHTFWVTTFPTANKTWVYDIATNSWHQRGFWNAGTGQFEASLSLTQAYVFGKHLVGDRKSGNVYWMSIQNLTDAGNLIRRVRRAPHISEEQVRLRHNSLQVDAETGLGPLPPLTDGSGNSRGPMMTLRWSDDGGHTWSNSYDVDCGQAGNYKTRAIWRRLGQSRDRVYEVSVSDPIAWRFIDAYLDADGYMVPTPRMVTSLRKQA